MNNVELILGGPGAGKTTHLLNIVDQELASGIHPREIAFVSFTKAAADEAAMRAADKFGIPREDFPWFRTIHSLAYQRLMLQRDDVLERRDWKAFGDLIGETLSGRYDQDEVISSGTPGDVMLRVVDYANTTMLTLEDAWHELAEPVDWFVLKRFEAAYRGFKADLGKIDFTDMLLHYINEGEPLDIKVAVIDEAQDLTKAQWAVVKRAFSRAERVYICGDDDQAIYRWAGADVDYFLGLTDNPTVLPVSHRLPRSVYDMAQVVASRISRRYSKTYEPTDKDGSVVYHLTPESVDLSAEGRWLVLARNRYHLQRVEQIIRESGHLYSSRGKASVDPNDVSAIRLWEDARETDREISASEVRTLCKAMGMPVPAMRELAMFKLREVFGAQVDRPWYDALEGISRNRLDYYMACVRRGERLDSTPRLRVETIHGVKGAEAENVMLMTDISSRTAKGFDINPDTEHRVFYVGVTRAMNSLHIVLPQTDTSYPL